MGVWGNARGYDGVSPGVWLSVFGCAFQYCFEVGNVAAPGFIVEVVFVIKAVIKELLSVIGCEDDQGVFPEVISVARQIWNSEFEAFLGV